MKKRIPEDSVLVPETAELKFEGMIFDVYQWPQQLFDGTEHTFEMLKRTDTVSVMAIVEGKVIVIDDEQPHLGKRRSFPGGRIDAEDASPLVAAKREIIEETGYTFKKWRLIKVRQPYRKIEWFVHVFLAWEPIAQQDPELDPGEKIAMELLPFDELKAEIMDNHDYLGEAQDIFKSLRGLDDLLSLPEFTGQEVDR